MSILKIKKILKTKEKIAKLNASKILNDINNKKKNIDAIDDYRKAYLATGRKIENLSGYEMANIETFIKNMASVSIIEVNDRERLEMLLTEKMKIWKKCANKTKVCNELVYNIGIENASKKEEELTEKINWLNILKAMEN